MDKTIKTIPLLRASDIECRVQSVKEKGCVLLVYKDARVDMKILDEVFGIDGWQRTHNVVNDSLFCSVKIWSDKYNCWIEKQDVGTESFTEKEKGQASDAFKRACFNIGIGRELYSAPFIYIQLQQDEVTNNNGKFSLKYSIEFSVKSIEYDSERNISKIVIVDKKGKVRFPFNDSSSIKEPTITDACEKMMSSKTDDEAVKCWNLFPQFVKEQGFIKACTEIRSKIKQSQTK